ncbi:hypothetical protein CAPTEDRAFT_166020 [Capitella teleta]|uniref:Globin domain-containing protein n=1 Tax=Capitella teleta TaxID=283909 RepID=R7UZI3_CAPTE|nr:hypothetical protein CAPTEDRAFT_166020 [Capitella teleta]|eukprot:ELU11998.1 hypothetical protein CAPTEDRAFT_166020 [Capitella teleta]
MRLVQMSWDIVQEDLAALGHGAFDRLFMDHPEIKDAFGPFKELSKDNIHFDRELRLHGVRVLRTVETVLDCRYDCVRLVRLLHNLGRKHVNYRANADYFEIVGRQFILVIASVVGDKWTPEVEESWSHLFTFVAYVMREAMLLNSLSNP